jgi:hypothetical protein
LPPRPIRHAVDPDDEAAGRKSTQVVIALDQQHVRAEPRRSDGGSRSGRPTADDEHVSFGEHRNLARWLKDSFSGAGAARRATSAEQLNPLCRADTAAVVAAPRRIAKDFALSGRSYRLGVLAVRHVLASRPIGEEEKQLKTAIEVHGRILSDFISL